MTYQPAKMYKGVCGEFVTGHHLGTWCDAWRVEKGERLWRLPSNTFQSWPNGLVSSSRGFGFQLSQGVGVEV